MTTLTCLKGKKNKKERNWWAGEGSRQEIKRIPVAVPIPINEEPALAIMARTSAKSTFTSPGICR